MNSDIIPLPGKNACPNCLTDCVEMRDENGWFWICPTCHQPLQRTRVRLEVRVDLKSFSESMEKAKIKLDMDERLKKAMKEAGESMLKRMDEMFYEGRPK